MTANYTLLILKKLSHLRYAILHGWQGLPEHWPSDLDIAVTPEDLPRLESALLDANAALPLVNHLRHESTCDYFVLALQDENKIQFFPVDSATDYRRNGRIWFNAEELLKGRVRRKNFWVVAPEVEFKYLLVKKTLKGTVPKHAAKRIEELLQALGSKATEIAIELLGGELGVQAVHWIETGSWEEFQTRIPALQRALKRQKLREDPLNPLRYWFFEIPRILQRWRYPTGFWVAVLGPDGAGKSTLIANLKKELEGAFRRTRNFHLMPGLLRREIDGTPVTDPHSSPPRPWPTSLLKLAYYWLEYTLGYWLKIRLALVRSTFVLFDRYYDDLLIDPKRYRYGGSMGLARWLRRFIPRPDLFLVLDVPVEGLLKRKQEVPPEELRRQAQAYRAFALETPDAYLLDGSLPPGEVTREAGWIILDYLHARYISRRHVWFPKAQTEKLGWLSQALDITITQDHPTHAWLRLPDGRGYLLPLANKEVFRRGLELYPAQGRKARLGKKMLGSLAGLGLKAPGLTKLNLQEQAGSVTQTLRSFFGEKNIHFAVSLGTPSPHRKPVLQALTSAGEVLGYAKVGWNEPTRALVKHEAQILKRLSREELPFDVPKVLHAHNHGERMLCVQSPPPNGHRLAPHSQHQVYIDTLCALASMGNVQRPLEASGFWQNIRVRAEKVRHPYWKRVLQESMEKVRQEWEGEEVPFHMAHGDFAPWNAFLVGGRLYLYDWEYATEESPAGYDLFHFEIQTLRLVEKRSPQEIYSLIVQPVGHSNPKRYWDIIGATPSVQRLLLKLYLLERLSFHCLTETTADHQRQLFQRLLQ